nr:MAG TPA: hypothetical protein [Microviridae sp.]
MKGDVFFMNKWFTALVTAIAAACSYLLGINNHL